MEMVSGAYIMMQGLFWVKALSNLLLSHDPVTVQTLVCYDHVTTCRLNTNPPPSMHVIPHNVGSANIAVGLIQLTDY